MVQMHHRARRLVLIHINLLHTRKSNFLNIHRNVILSYTPIFLLRVKNTF